MGVITEGGGLAYQRLSRHGGANQRKGDSSRGDTHSLNLADFEPYAAITDVPRLILGMDGYDEERLMKLNLSLRLVRNDDSVSRWVSIQRITSPTSGLIPIITTHLRTFAGMASELSALVGVLKDEDVQDNGVTTCISALTRVREAAPTLVQPYLSDSTPLPLALCRASAELIKAIDECRGADLHEQFRSDVMDEIILASHYGALSQREKGRLYRLI